jgi:hypothetical protein
VDVVVVFVVLFILLVCSGKADREVKTDFGDMMCSDDDGDEKEDGEGGKEEEEEEEERAELEG